MISGRLWLVRFQERPGASWTASGTSSKPQEQPGKPWRSGQSSVKARGWEARGSRLEGRGSRVEAAGPRLGVLPEEFLEAREESGVQGGSQSSRKVAEEALGSRGEAVELDKRERQRKALLGSCGQLQAGLVASWWCADFPNTF